MKTCYITYNHIDSSFAIYKGKKGEGNFIERLQTGCHLSDQGAYDALESIVKHYQENKYLVYYDNYLTLVVKAYSKTEFIQNLGVTKEDVIDFKVAQNLPIHLL